MLSITITPTALIFTGLSDELFIDLAEKYKDFEFRNDKKGVAVLGKPAKLFKLLLDLSYTYDIELR